MPLLDTITAAAAALDAGDLRPTPNLPILLDASAALPLLHPNSPSPSPSSPPIRRLSGWTPPPCPSDPAKKLLRKLRSKLNRKDGALDPSDVARVFDSFAGDRCGDALHSGDALETLVDACARSGLWDRLRGLILRGLVTGNSASALVGKLVENNRADLLCVSLRCIRSLRPADLLVMLRYFLSPTKASRGAMAEVRKEWERQGLLAIEKAGDEGLSRRKTDLTREAAVLIAMAHDGFTPSETCLHHVFSSPNAEGLVMSTAVSRLQGAEVLRLVRYFGKWLEKYERFPEAVPLSGSKAPGKVVAHKWVPSLEAVAKGLALVVDEHFSYLVLKAEFHELLRSMERVVRNLVSAANACHVLANVLENLPLDARGLWGAPGVF